MTNLMPWRRIGNQRNGAILNAPVSQMRLDWDRLFDRVLDDAWNPSAEFSRALPLDVSETEEQIRVRAELPGMDPKEIEIELTGDVLTISGQKVEETEAEEGTRHFSERQFGSFRRSMKLPCAIEPDRVEAEYKNGVLSIRLEKADTVRPKRIPVTAG